MEFDFWKGDLWRSEYVRVIITTQDDTALFLQPVMRGQVRRIQSVLVIAYCWCWIRWLYTCTGVGGWGYDVGLWAWQGMSRCSVLHVCHWCWCPAWTCLDEPWWRVFVWLLDCGVRYGVCSGGCWPCGVGVAWRYHLMRATRRFRVVSLGEWRVNHHSRVGRRLELCTLPVRRRLVLGQATCWCGNEPGDDDVRGMSCRLGEQWDEQYETVTNVSEHEARNRHVAMNECKSRQVTVEG